MNSPAETVLLTVAYNGQAYSGVAVQSNATTVSGRLLKALQRMDPSITSLKLASRTDAGVHAHDQKIAFNTQRIMPMRAWVLGPIPYLPRDITIRAAERVPYRFNPRFNTALKTYRYLLLRDRLKDPFWYGRAWRVMDLHSDEALQRLRREWQCIRGTHNFAAFASSKDTRPHTTRSLVDVSVQPMQDDPRLLALQLTGDGFLHNMVRILVGTAVDVGRGRRTPGAMQRALHSKQRTDAGKTAPADGLYLQQVILKRHGGDRWPAR